VSRSNAVDDQADRGLRFDQLFNSHYDAIYRYCARRLGGSDAEDAAADVFAVAWRHLDQMPPGDRARAWLFGVAYRVVANQYRSRRRRTGLTARLQTLAGVGGDDADRDPTTGSDVELVLMALDEISRTDRELLRLSTWDGLTRAEIGYVLGIKENAVDQRLHRARARLKTQFELLVTQSRRSEPREASA
jgi:RNA polymerase sigma-70 factor (ECF subfamily)